jgi:hypothetical protein
MHVLGDIPPSRVRVKYAGLSRPLPQMKKEVVRQWALRYAGSTETYTGPYETEMLFEEGGTGYWLAVKRRAMLSFARELKRGDEADLYLIRLSAAKEAGVPEPALLMPEHAEVELIRPRRA